MADNTQRDKLDKLYGGLQTLPTLIGDLAQSIADAQVRLDQSYLESLAAFAKLVKETIKPATPPATGATGAGGAAAAGGATPATPATEFLNLFQAIAPSRYQFTETVIEVRADLQTASTDQFQIDASAGVQRTVFAATVNVSYLKRTASDYQATAVVRTVLNAIPADPNLLTQLLARAGTTPSATPLRGEDRLKLIKEALGDLALPTQDGGGATAGGTTTAGGATGGTATGGAASGGASGGTATGGAAGGATGGATGGTPNPS